MIIEVPSHLDFEEAGVSMLNLGWNAVADLFRDLEFADVKNWDDDGKTTEEFWDAAKHPMSIALALVQQGIELLLKARIAAVSPFLLLAGTPREWPSGGDHGEVPFANFRTLDSHELIRAHDTICARRVTEVFRQEFDRLRRLRNVVLHGVDKRLRPSGRDIFQAVLTATEELLEPRGWMPRRNAFIRRSPQSVATGMGAPRVLVPEGTLLMELFTPAELSRFFGYDKKARSYICHFCASELRDEGVLPRTAQLRPNSSESTALWCFVCCEEQIVTRSKCPQKSCKGNVIHEDGTCMSCNEDRSGPHPRRRTFLP